MNLRFLLDSDPERRKMPNQQVSWTVLDEYSMAVRRACQKIDFECRETLGEYDDPETVRRFVAESRTRPTVEMEPQYPWQSSYKKTLPAIKVQIGIFANDLDHPVKPMTERLPQFGSFTQAEQAEYSRRQDELVLAINEEVSQARKNLTQAQTLSQRAAIETSMIETRSDKERVTEPKRKRRVIICFLIAILPIALGLLTNIAANQIPDWFQPYLPLSWPILCVVAILFIILSVCQAVAK